MPGSIDRQILKKPDGPADDVVGDLGKVRDR
jgi:hypothetical protein